MDTEQVVACLRSWSAEHGELPRPIYDTAYLERCGVIVDLADGSMFEPREDWHDFAARWAAERRRRGRAVSVEALGLAIERANVRGYDATLCRAIAKTVMGDGREAEWPLTRQNGCASVEVRSSALRAAAS